MDPSSKVDFPTIYALSKALEARDGYTHHHSQRVGFYAAAAATAMGLEQFQVEMIRTAGALHDVGKIGIRDAILLKPGRLTTEEFHVMWHAPELGEEIVAAAGLPEIAKWIRHVHERYAGGGYPDGLAGDEIPLESRILHGADALEAMTSPRIYRKARSVEEALLELEMNAGTQFDPKVTFTLTELIRGGKVIVGEQPRLASPTPATPEDQPAPSVDGDASPAEQDATPGEREEEHRSGAEPAPLG